MSSSSGTGLFTKTSIILLRKTIKHTSYPNCYLCFSKVCLLKNELQFISNSRGTSNQGVSVLDWGTEREQASSHPVMYLPNHFQQGFWERMFKKPEFQTLEARVSDIRSPLEFSENQQEAECCFLATNNSVVKLKHFFKQWSWSVSVSLLDHRLAGSPATFIMGTMTGTQWFQVTFPSLLTNATPKSRSNHQSFIKNYSI